MTHRLLCKAHLQLLQAQKFSGLCRAVAALAESPEFHLSLRLQPGDIEIVHNPTIFHSRGEVIDGQVSLTCLPQHHNASLHIHLSPPCIRHFIGLALVILAGHLPSEFCCIAHVLVDALLVVQGCKYNSPCFQVGLDPQQCWRSRAVWVVFELLYFLLVPLPLAVSLTDWLIKTTMS